MAFDLKWRIATFVVVYSSWFKVQALKPDEASSDLVRGDRMVILWRPLRTTSLHDCLGEAPQCRTENGARFARAMFCAAVLWRAQRPRDPERGGRGPGVRRPWETIRGKESPNHFVARVAEPSRCTIRWRSSHDARSAR